MGGSSAWWWCYYASSHLPTELRGYYALSQHFAILCCAVLGSAAPCYLRAGLAELGSVVVPCHSRVYVCMYGTRTPTKQCLPGVLVLHFVRLHASTLDCSEQVQHTEELTFVYHTIGTLLPLTPGSVMCVGQRARDNLRGLLYVHACHMPFVRLAAPYRLPVCWLC